MKPLDNAEAMAVVKESITQIIPDADFTQVETDDKFRDKFRDVLELDSLDFLSLVGCCPSARESGSTRRTTRN
ncbi:hypothetical protein ACFWIZ_15525 [Streptomyces sp. NPDC127044]